MQQVSRLLTLIVKHEKWSDFKKSLQLKKIVKMGGTKELLKKTTVKQPNSPMVRLNEAVHRLQQSIRKKQYLLEKRIKVKQLYQMVKQVMNKQQHMRQLIKLEPMQQPQQPPKLNSSYKHTLEARRQIILAQSTTIQFQIRSILCCGTSQQLNSIQSQINNMPLKQISQSITSKNKQKQQCMAKKVYLQWSLLVMSQQMSAIRSLHNRQVTLVPYLDSVIYSIVFFIATELQYTNRILLRKRMYVSQDMRSMYPIQLVQIQPNQGKQREHDSNEQLSNHVAIHIRDLDKLDKALNIVCTVFSGHYTKDNNNGVVVVCRGTKLKITVNSQDITVERCLKIEPTAE